MAFASGTFSLLVAYNPVVTGTTISSTAFNNTLTDIATGLTTCLLKDGTQTATASIPFAQGISVGTNWVLDASGNLAVTTNKFTVTASSGNTAIAGTLTLSSALTYGGVTLSNAVTGTGNMVLSASPTLTGTLTGAAANFSGAVTVNAHVNVLGGTGILSGISSYGATVYSKDDRTIAAMVVGHSSDAASGTEIFFVNSNGVVGSISTNGTATAYNTSSDERLKRKLNPATSVDVLRDTQVWDFEWIKDRSIDRGVMAQEAYRVKPSAVFVGGDNPTINPWTADYSKYVPDLIVGWQSHDRQIADLLAWKAKVEGVA